MYASCQTNKTKSDNITLTFNHKLAKVIVILKKGDGLLDSDLDEAVVKLTNTYVKCSIASVDMNTFGNITVSNDAANDRKDIIVGKWDSSTNSESNGIAAIVVPQTVLKETQLFEVKLKNNATYKYIIPSDASNNVEFAQEKVHTYTLTLTTAGITVNANIANWGTGTDGNGNATLQ